ncbi:MAG TPA: porin [Burkholderiaceae bacterium]|jgi:predicted porin
MKKSLLALAVLGAFASAAQAQVTIGGVAQIDYKQYKLSQGNAAAARVYQTESRIDDDLNSRFWLTGSEDLGGGMSAIFKMENRVDLDTGAGIGTGVAAGESWVGLKSSSLGTLTAGRHSLNYVSGFATEVTPNGLTAAPSAFYANFTILDQVNGVFANASRIPNSIKYTSPSMAGFSVVAGYSTSVSTEGVVNGTNNYQDGGAAYLEGSYNNGPIYVGLSYFKAVAEGRVGTDQKDTRLNGAYKFPFGLKIGFNYDKQNLKNSATGVQTGDRSAWALPVSYSFGANTVLLTYASAGDTTTTTKVSDSGAKFLTLGYDYSLSKRTHVGAYYNRLANGRNGAYTPFLSGLLTGSSTVAGETATTFGVGILHNF